jgi:uncharacterized RDD family membrane protein YckC
MSGAIGELSDGLVGSSQMKERETPGSGLEKTMLSQPTARAGAPERDLTGMQLCHYSVKKLIGRGAMGSVYLGHDTSLNRPVALKVLAPEIAHDPEMIRRFVLEAQSQARLVHPNVVQMYFVGQEQGINFFAMEYVEGPALDGVQEQRGRVPWPEVLEFALAAARGLSAARQAGFIHRDVKPSNMLLDGKGGVKIFDFGLVKNMDGDSSLTREGTVVGSPYYMAPEQGRSEAVDHRSDIYSLGCTVYHLLCGLPPFDAPSPVGVISKHVTDRAAPIRTVVAEVPEPLAAVVEKMMAKAPGDRFAEYEPLIAALEASRPEARKFSGFWARTSALGIDLIPFVLLAPFLGFWSLLVAAAYFIAAPIALGRTLGKRLFQLRVVDLSSGAPISWRTSLIRFGASCWGPALVLAVLSFGYVEHRHDHIDVMLDHLSRNELMVPVGYFLAILLIVVGYLAGFVVAAFHPKHQALHVLLTKTVVI